MKMADTIIRSALEAGASRHTTSSIAASLIRSTAQQVDGQVPIGVNQSVATRAESVARSLEAQHVLHAINAAPSHNLGLAIKAAKPRIGPKATSAIPGFGSQNGAE